MANKASFYRKKLRGDTNMHSFSWYCVYTMYEEICKNLITKTVFTLSKSIIGTFEPNTKFYTKFKSKAIKANADNKMNARKY